MPFPRDIEFETTADAVAPAPGTEGDTSGDGLTDTPAGESNTDTQSGTPATIPYSRFKEVNDSLRQYKELADRGYPVDQLQRLINFETEYLQDPVGTWLRQAAELELPDEVKSAIQAISGDGATPPTPKKEPAAEGEEEKPPKWAEPLLQERQEREQKQQAELEAEAAAARRKMVDSMLEKWDEADKADNIKTPRAAKLAYIMANAAGASGPEEVLSRARAEWLETRDETLSDVAVLKRGTPSPLSVPSGGATAVDNPVPTPKTMEEARALAMAKLKAEQGGE